MRIQGTKIMRIHADADPQHWVHLYAIAADEENKLHLYYIILWYLLVTISKTRQVKVWKNVLSVSPFSLPRLGGGGRECA